MLRWLTKLRAWWSEPACPGAEIYQVPGREEDFRHLFGPLTLPHQCIDDDDRMRSLSVRMPDADFWDIARDDEGKQPEPGRIEYRFLGITGLEDE